ncbi:MAG: class I SAM-dependent methyltransferase, partial [Deltaproteobacteria bacterium]|nr:class I SAM-dependent methyltransferase [Deltaproteobacteria bacterium]
PWLNKYIFPNSMLPSAKQITSAAEGLFVLEDWHSFGQYYDKTLMAWYNNFIKNWTKIKDKYDERFYRMWTYYLLSCAGSFRSRRNQLWQIVFLKKGIKGGYRYREQSSV